MSTAETFKKLEELETKKTLLHAKLEKEKKGTPEWLDIRWDIDDLIMDICDLEQTL